ncbi:MAG: metallophosphoesterase family protein [Candidatus Dormiibacterota bacterium]
MRLCVISDIHGNVEALRAALRRIRVMTPDLVLIAGDLAAHGPRPSETLAELRELGQATTIRGNTDRYLVDPATVPLRNWPEDEAPERLRSLEWTREQLGDDGLQFLAGLPAQAEIDDCILVHGSPGSDEKGIFPSTPLEAFDTPAWSCVMACGHTHVPAHRRFGGRHLVNAGSVAWNLDGDPRPSFAVVETDGHGAAANTLERVDYDRAAVVDDLETRQVPWREKVRRFIGAGRVS